MFTFKNTKNHFIISKKVSSLEELYVKPIIDKLNKTYKLDTMHEIYKINENPFLTNKKKETIIATLLKEIKIRMMMKKIIFRKKNKTIRNVNYTEQISLSLENLSIYPKKDLIKVYNSKKIWVFTNVDMVRIFRLGIMNQGNYFPLPLKPKNPYTNQDFTYGQLHNIIMQLKYTGIKIPIYIQLFTKYDFNLEKMVLCHKKYFALQAIDHEINNFSDIKYIKYIKYIIKTETDHKLCKYCFRKIDIKDIKNIFKNVVRTEIITTHLLLDNDIFFQENIETQIDIIMNHYPKLNLNNHFLDHRKTVKIKRKKPFFNYDENLKFNFTQNIPPGGIFVFTAGSSSTNTDTNTDWLSLKEIQRLFSIKGIGIRILFDNLSAYLNNKGYLSFKNFETYFEILFKNVAEQAENEVNIFRKKYIIKRLFSLFDNRHYGLIKFREIASGLSILCGGNNEDISFSLFSLYDIENKEYITLEDFKEILSSLFNVIYDMEIKQISDSSITKESYVTNVSKKIFEGSELIDNKFLSFYDFQNWFREIIDSVKTLWTKKKRKRRVNQGIDGKHNKHKEPLK
jgi:hypothetical protein